MFETLNDFSREYTMLIESHTIPDVGYSGGSRISKGGANLLFDKFFPKTAWKWRNSDPGGCVPCAPPPPPPWSANGICHKPIETLKVPVYCRQFLTIFISIQCKIMRKLNDLTGQLSSVCIDTGLGLIFCHSLRNRLNFSFLLKLPHIISSSISSLPQVL